MSLTPATNRQVPDHSIMDFYNKQCYLGNQFVIPVANTSSGTSEIPLILINNTVGSGKGAFVGMKKITSLTAGDSAIIRCYLNPTVTGAGTPVTPSNVRPANVNAAVSTVTTGPTVSGNGTLVDVVSAAALMSGLSQLLEILDPGQTMLITLQASASSATTSTIIGFYEI